MSVRAWVWGLSLCTLGCATTSARYECERHGGRPSARLTTEHFVITSDLPPEDLRLEARRLERLWDAFTVYLQASPSKTARIQVLLSRDEVAGDFLPGAAGFVTGDLERVMVTRSSKEQTTNAHELAHVVIAVALPSVSRWLNEGVAEYLGDAEFKREYVVRFGRWRWGGGLVEPLEALWAWDRSPRTPTEEEPHYQSAWAWVHYLTNHDEARLHAVWARIAAGAPAREAFEAVFPPAGNEALRAKVQAYVDAARFSGWESTLQRDHALSEPTPVAPWEVHLLKRKLYRLVGAAARARAEVELASALAPTPEPDRLLVTRTMEALSGPERLERLNAALPGTSSREVRLAVATAIDEPPERRVELLEALAAEDPDDPWPKLALAQLLLRLERPRAVEFARAAASLAPWSVDARLTLTEALADEGRCRDATASLEAARGVIVERTSGAGPRIERLRQSVAECREVP